MPRMSRQARSGATFIEAFMVLAIWAAFMSFYYLAQNGSADREREYAERVTCRVILDRFEKTVATYETETGKHLSLVDSQSAQEMVQAGLLTALPICPHFHAAAFTYCRDADGHWSCLYHGRDTADLPRPNSTTGGLGLGVVTAGLALVLLARSRRPASEPVGRIPTVDEFLARHSPPPARPVSHPRRSPDVLESAPIPEEQLEIHEVSRPRGHCPVCATPVETGAVACGDCDVPHHAECREWFGRCGVYGCGAGRPS
jgi:hypothetical protein